MEIESLTPYKQPTTEEFAVEQAAQLGLSISPELMKSAAEAHILVQKSGAEYSLAQAEKARAEARKLTAEAVEKEQAVSLADASNKEDQGRRSITRWFLLTVGLAMSTVSLILYVYFVITAANAGGGLTLEMLKANSWLVYPGMFGIAFMLGEKFIAGAAVISVLTAVLPALLK